MTDNTLNLINEYLTQGGYSPGIDPETLEREAALVAAAPDLLAALVRFASAVEVAEALEEMPEGLFPESMADALAAIAKAKGE